MVQFWTVQVCIGLVSCGSVCTTELEDEISFFNLYYLCACVYVFGLILFMILCSIEFCVTIFWAV